jgi:3-hydroxyisobutyrate dehydrogenase-like beta-hydroxyacid dehydrogenase
VILGGNLAGLNEAAAAAVTAYGSKLIDAGPIGSGAALKLAFNVMTYAQFAAATAAFDIVRTAGGDTDALIEAWTHVGQLGTLTTNFLPVLSIPPEHVAGRVRRSFEASAGLADKDLQLAAAAMGGRPATHAAIEAMRAAMPEVFGLTGVPTSPTTTDGDR